jgi:integrase
LIGRAGLLGVTFHGLRHSFVAILVAAGCNVREVSEWAGHHNVAFTLTRYGGLFEDGSDEAVSRLDALLSGLLGLPRGSFRRSEVSGCESRTPPP